MSTLSIPEGLALIRERAAGDHWLAVLITTGARGPSGPSEREAPPDPQVSVVNATVSDHPLTGVPTVALVAQAGTAKLANLRRHPRATLVFREGWQWVAVRGPVELAGPDDPMPGLDPEGLRLLLRRIYLDAGGQHPDLGEYDRAMAADRRCAVLVTPEHIWG